MSTRANSHENVRFFCFLFLLLLLLSVTSISSIYVVARMNTNEETPRSYGLRSRGTWVGLSSCCSRHPWWFVSHCNLKQTTFTTDHLDSGRHKRVCCCRTSGNGAHRPQLKLRLDWTGQVGRRQACQDHFFVSLSSNNKWDQIEFVWIKTSL